jgi:hypothetical protein
MPRLSRGALLALVEWVKKRSNKPTDSESNGTKITTQSTSSDSVIEANGVKKIELDTKGGDL